MYANDQMSKAVFGGGCFWCTEALFIRLQGVLEVLPGYMGGTSVNPTYEEVCTGMTGHAEVIQITYDPKLISFQALLEVFFATHNPTTLNRQGNDIGTQYRSVVFYENEEQKAITRAYIQFLGEQDRFDTKIVTELAPAIAFYAAEDYHQNYFAQNQNQPYCVAVVAPKVQAFENRFNEQLKNEKS